MVAAILIAVIIIERQQRDRRSQRYICFLSATILVEKSTVHVKVLDLSLLGCKIELDDFPGKLEEVTLNIGDVCRKGHVIWRNEVYAGVQFKRKLKKNQMLALLASPRKT